MLILLVFLILTSKPFVNNFIEFNLPDNWDCEPFDDDWTCQIINVQEKNHALIILSYRLSSTKDSLIEFNNYLKVPKILKSNNKPSKHIYTNFKNILGHEWVDSVHEDADLLNYTSRYLATLKAGRTVLVSFIVENQKYNLYMPQLYSMIESLKLRQGLPPQTIKADLQGLVGRLDEKFFKKVNRQTNLTDDIVLSTSSSEHNVLYISIALGISFFILIYIVLKRKKNKTQKAKGRIR